MTEVSNQATWQFAVGTLVTMNGGSTVYTVTDQVEDEDDGKPFYYLDSETSKGVDASDDDLTFFMSASDAAARNLPTADEVSRSLNWLGDAWGDEFTVTESEASGDGKVLLSARTASGLPFTCYAQITDVQGEDF